MSDTDPTFGNNTLQRVNFKNVLSFGEKGLGEDGNGLELKPLNVLIGPNGSGKSNFLKCIDLARSSPGDFSHFFRVNYGIESWIRRPRTPKAIHFDIRATTDKLSWRHVAELSYQPEHLTEWITIGRRKPVKFDSSDSEEKIGNRSALSSAINNRIAPSDTIKIAKFYSGTVVFHADTFGFYSRFRGLMPRDYYAEFLTSGIENFYDVLSELQKNEQIKQRIDQLLSEFLGVNCSYNIYEYNASRDLKLEINGVTFPAANLSDGTLRFIYLLSILVHPNPPFVVCLEEPELGMHPDIIPNIAKLLVEASERTQLIVTTHSDMLLDSLTDDPECVVVCERDEDGTSMKRVKLAHVESWLENYGMGQLWMKGVLGGTRW